MSGFASDIRTQNKSAPVVRERVVVGAGGSRATPRPRFQFCADHDLCLITTIYDKTEAWGGNNRTSGCSRAAARLEAAG